MEVDWYTYWHAALHLHKGLPVHRAFYSASAVHDLPLFENSEIKRSPTPIMRFYGSKDPMIHDDGKITPDGPTCSLLEWLEDWRKGITVLLLKEP